MKGTSLNPLSFRIVTPEGVAFSIPLATPIRRMQAALIDLIVIFSLLMGSLYITTIFSLFLNSAAFALFFFLQFFITTGFYIFTEWRSKGQTPGKKMMGIQVMDADGLRLQFSQIVIRNLLRVVDQFPFLYLIGGTVAVFHPRCRRLGDLAANTIVIRKEKIPEPEWEQIRTDKYNSLRKYPHLAARLRQVTHPAELELALQAILRRKDFNPDDRLSLFSYLARHFQQYQVFPEEAHAGISDEQYIRNLVDLVYSK